MLVAEILLGISISFISDTDSALLFESLKADRQEQNYARHVGRMSGFGQISEACGQSSPDCSTPLFPCCLFDHIQQEIPSAIRDGILSLQSLAFRLSFVCTGPVVGMLADRVGVQRTFLLLCFVFVVVLPPAAWLFFGRPPISGNGCYDRSLNVE